MKTSIDTARTMVIGTDEGFEQAADTLTILFADAALPISPTQKDGPADPFAAEHAAELRREHAAVIERYAGRVSKQMGNSMMAEFSDAASAVRAAVEMQRLARESNRPLDPEQRAALRIGIHSAEGPQGIDLFGSVVNRAAAITKQADDEKIFISKPVFEAIEHESDLHVRPASEVNDDSAIFQVDWTEAPAGIPPRYEVLSQIGSGGMGVVYKVRDLEAGDIVALKILKAGVASDPAMQENLRREVLLSRKVTHKNVCRIHEFSRSQGAAYISMEFVDGESLSARLRRAGAIAWPEALGMARQICAGLREAHLQGIVHRDLKPANILLGRANGSVKIADFGIARSFQNTAHMTGTLVGTPAYMAPEQLELKRIDARTDIYAAGQLLYEMVTGKPAFEGDTPIAVALKKLNESPKRPRELAPDLPVFAENAILKCLQKDPAKRFASVDELIAALDRKPQAQPSGSIWAGFVADMRAAYVDVKAAAVPAMKNFVDLAMEKSAKARMSLRHSFRQIDWKALAAHRRAKPVAVAAGVAFALSVTVLAVHAGHKAHEVSTAHSAAAPVAVESANPSPVASPAATAAVGSTNDSAIASSLASDSLHLSDAAIASAVVASALASPAPAPTAATKAAHGKSRAPAQARAAAKFGGSAPVAGPSPEVAVSSPAASDAPAPSESQPQDSAQQTSVALVVPEPAPASAAPINKAGDSDATPLQDAAPHYFEVGSFKDAAWADEAVQKLTQLGFHAESVHKKLAWMQSYQVRIGPFSDVQSMTEAGKRLTEQGFKPHSVK